MNNPILTAFWVAMKLWSDWCPEWYFRFARRFIAPGKALGWFF